MSLDEQGGTMADMPRAALLAELAQAATRLAPGHPTRVAIDGRSAAGKTTLADELAGVVAGDGREVLRASIDDFHRPGHKFRSQRNEWTPETYYAEGYDIAAFRRLVLEPLGPGGSRRCRPALFDSLHDAWLPASWRTVGDDAVAIIDGIFLLRSELAAAWDFVIWLDIDFATMIARACRRDIAWVGSVTAVAERYRHFWVPMHRYYEGRCDPASRADVEIDNRDPLHPLAVWRE